MLIGATVEKDTSFFILALVLVFPGYYYWNAQKIAKKSEPKSVSLFESRKVVREELKRFSKVEMILYVDPESRTWKVGIVGQEHPFDELYQYELVEIGKTDSTVQMKGRVSIGRALVGGALAGPAGMVIGGVTGKKKGIINSDNFVNKLYVNISTAGKREQVYLINRKTFKESRSYSRALDNAYDVMALLDYIKAN